MDADSSVSSVIGVGRHFHKRRTKSSAESLLNAFYVLFMRLIGEIIFKNLGNISSGVPNLDVFLHYNDNCTTLQPPNLHLHQLRCEQHAPLCII